jgi:hypothetical protein
MSRKFSRGTCGVPLWLAQAQKYAVISVGIVDSSFFDTTMTAFFPIHSFTTTPPCWQFQPCNLFNICWRCFHFRWVKQSQRLAVPVGQINVRKSFIVYCTFRAQNHFKCFIPKSTLISAWTQSLNQVLCPHPWPHASTTISCMRMLDPTPNFWCWIHFCYCYFHGVGGSWTISIILNL